MYEDLKKEAAEAFEELLSQSHFRKGSLIVIGGFGSVRPAEGAPRFAELDDFPEAARVEVAKARLRAEAQAERIGEQATEIDRLRAALEAVSARAVTAEQRAAVAEARLADAQASADALIAELRARIAAAVHAA